MKDNKDLGEDGAPPASQDRATDAPHEAPTGLRPVGSVSTGAGAFTPGPWLIADGDLDRSPGDEGPRWDVHVPHRETVAYVCRENDANLIAAAPDLIDALADMVEMASEMADGATCWRIARARAALRKATGQ